MYDLDNKHSLVTKKKKKWVMLVFTMAVKMHDATVIGNEFLWYGNKFLLQIMQQQSTRVKINIENTIKISWKFIIWNKRMIIWETCHNNINSTCFQNLFWALSALLWPLLSSQVG